MRAGAEGAAAGMEEEPACGESPGRCPVFGAVNAPKSCIQATGLFIEPLDFPSPRRALGGFQLEKAAQLLRCSSGARERFAGKADFSYQELSFPKFRANTSGLSRLTFCHQPTGHSGSLFQRAEKVQLHYWEIKI